MIQWYAGKTYQNLKFPDRKIMKIVQEEILIKNGEFQQTAEWNHILSEIRYAIMSVVWPPGSSNFAINPLRKRNGVKPIKEGCMLVLRDQFGWSLESAVFTGDTTQPGKVDAIRQTSLGTFVLEWETGNISSSHRALNKLVLGMLRKVIIGGVLILPTRLLYKYLTDRVGNYEELQPYFPIWRNAPLEKGLLMVIAIEHDTIDATVPLIRKGTDGRAML